LFVVWFVCCLGCLLFGLFVVWAVCCLGCLLFGLFVVWVVCCLGCLLFLKAFAYFNKTDNTKNISTTCFEDTHNYNNNIMSAACELGIN
jgi:hypothetical protein